MATAAVAPAKADLKSEIVTNAVLAGRANTLALSAGFGGTANPTSIWTDMVRDTPQAFGYYRELEEKDTDVSTALDKLKRSVLKRDYSIAAADDSPAAVEVKDFVQAQFDRLPNLHEILDGILDAPGYGVSIAEIIWSASAKTVELVDIRDCPQELFSFGPRTEPQVGPLQFLREAYAQQGEPVPDNKFIVYSHRPRSRNRRGRPLLRAVFWPSWFKRQALRMWLRAAEKGPGTAAVKHSNSATADEKLQALRVAEAFVESVAVAVPENVGLIEALLTNARPQNPAVYKQLYDEMKYEITRRILGQTLTSFGNEGGTGSLALGEVHGESEDDLAVSLARATANVIQQQLVRPLVLFNFGPNAPMPTFAFEVDDEEDLQKRSLIDERLQFMGTPLPISYIREKYNIPEPQDGEICIQRSTDFQRAQQMGVPIGDRTARERFGIPELQPGEEAIQPMLVPGASGDAGAAAAFASDDPQTKASVEDVRRLMGQLRGDSQELYAAHVMNLAEEVLANGGVRK